VRFINQFNLAATQFLSITTSHGILHIRISRKFHEPFISTIFMSICVINLTNISHKVLEFLYSARYQRTRFPTVTSSQLGDQRNFQPSVKVRIPRWSEEDTLRAVDHLPRMNQGSFYGSREAAAGATACVKPIDMIPIVSNSSLHM
ncbi:unnamed protein product, partial [Meganyctiphanes norvegica]